MVSFALVSTTNTHQSYRYGPRAWGNEPDDSRRLGAGGVLAREVVLLFSFLRLAYMSKESQPGQHVSEVDATADVVFSEIEFKIDRPKCIDCI